MPGSRVITWLHWFCIPICRRTPASQPWTPEKKVQSPSCSPDLKPKRLVVIAYGKPLFICCQGFAVNCGSASTVRDTGELVRLRGGWLQNILDQSLAEFEFSRHFLRTRLAKGGAIWLRAFLFGYRSGALSESCRITFAVGHKTCFSNVLAVESPVSVANWPSGEKRESSS